MGFDDHLLRTLAAVPPGSRVLDLGATHAGALAGLGFDVYATATAELDIPRGAVAAVLGAEEAARRVTAAEPAALGYPDAFADWVVALGAYDGAPSMAALLDALAETRRVLRPGGWVFARASAALFGEAAPPAALSAAFALAGFALAEAPVREGDGAAATFRGIYRHVGEGTIG